MFNLSNKKPSINSSLFTDPFLIVDSLDNLKAFWGFEKNFVIVENNLDEVRFFEDLNHRRRLDVEVLSLVAANVPVGKMLDIGTYLGHSAARMAVNSPRSHIYTVNIHPDDLRDSGKLITGVPTVEEIGSFYRQKNLKNIQQVFANTKTWNPPEEVNNLSLAYIDGCHDKEFVYSDTKLIIDRVISGGFILWHDCSPIYCKNFHWIDEAMQGIERLIREEIIKGYVLNVRNSWIGIWKKQ
jgi:predicted O-methyltransferase YrrM